MGFDHKVLLSKLFNYDLHKSLVRWDSSFLLDKTQFVRICPNASTSLRLNGGISQGSRLGPILCAIMVDDLLSN